MFTRNFGICLHVKMFHIQRSPLLKICIVEEPKINQTPVQTIKNHSDVFWVSRALSGMAELRVTKT
jgi:hypothetical protein